MAVSRGAVEDYTWPGLTRAPNAGHIPRGHGGGICKSVGQPVPLGTLLLEPGRDTFPRRKGESVLDEKQWQAPSGFTVFALVMLSTTNNRVKNTKTQQEKASSERGVEMGFPGEVQDLNWAWKGKTSLHVKVGKPILGMGWRFNWHRWPKLPSVLRGQVGNKCEK